MKFKFKFKFSLILIGIFCANLNAEQNLENFTTQNALSDQKTQNFKLENIIVSATGFAQDADNDIRNVIVIYAKTLKERGFNDLKQTLLRVGGVSFNNNQIDIRGQGNKANVAVKVMIDGQMTNLLDATTGTTPINALSVDDIERIEIIPGGGSVLYGNNTRGGVINIITRKNSKAKIKLKSELNSGRTGGGIYSSFGAPFGENLQLDASFDVFDKKAHIKGSGESGIFAKSKLYFDFENSNLKFGGSFFSNKNKSSGGVSKAQLEADKKAGGEISELKITRPSFDINYHLNHENLEFDALAFWHKQKIKYLNKSTAGSEFSDSLSGLNAKGKIPYFDNSYLIFGYDSAFHQNTRDLKTKQIFNTPIASGNLSIITKAKMQKQSHSIFALNSSKFNDIFGLSFGARGEYAKYKSRRQNQTSGYVAPMGRTIPINSSQSYDIPPHDDLNFAFEVTPNFSYSDTGKIYLKYERGFISPNPSQFTNKRCLLNCQSSYGAVYEYYFADLKSEKFDTFEVAIEDFWWNFHSFKITAFYTKTKDEITQFGPGYSSWWENKNIDETSRFGLEFETRQDFEKFGFYQNFTYLDAKISAGLNDGLRVPYVSRVKFGFGADYEFNKFLKGFFDLIYFSRPKDAGSSDENGKITQMAWMKDYFLADLGANFSYKKFEIQAGVKNLLDREYYDYASTSSDLYKIAPGRSFYLNLSYDF